MKILELKCLNESQVADIRNLERICQRYEKLKGDLFLANEINFNHEIKCFYLLYDEDRLISCLTMFVPTSKEAEISAYTLPSHRGKGYFDTLLNRAIEELKLYSISDILFVEEPNGNDAKGVLKKLNAKYEYSEYLMVYNREFFKNQNTKLTLQPIPQEKIEDMISLNTDIFGGSFEDEKSMIINSINSPKIISYMAILGDEIIGTCNVNLEEEASIFGLGISQRYQGKGYGKEMLNLLLKILINMGIKDITLEVDSNNGRAYNLYIKSGFKVKTRFDYYRYS